jgi:hypothetical protein
MYDVNVYVKSTDSIIGKIDSIYIKEVTSWFFIIWDIEDHMSLISLA